jgi:hypothetical protein
MAPGSVKYSSADVERTLRKHEKRLLAYPNVIYLAIGEKYSLGKGKSRLAIRVFVSKKVEHGSPGAVPKRLRAIKSDGSLANYYIPTDIEERPSTLQTLGIKGADSITGATLGSIGFVFKGNNDKHYILTNAHVALAINEEADGQPLFDLEHQQIGTISRATTLLSNPGHIHSVDAAVAIPTEHTRFEPLMIADNPSPIVSYGVKDTFNKIFGQKFFYHRQNGARLTFQEPNLISTPRNVHLAGHTLLFSNFFELKMVEGVSLPKGGDSGSVLVSDSGNGLIAHALLFAGSDNIIGVIALADVFMALRNSESS